MSTSASPRSKLVSSGWQFPMLPSRAVKIYIISYFHVNKKFFKIYGEPNVHKFCAIDIFWNITRRQAISTVSKSHHVLGRGLMIQRVLLYSYWLGSRTTAASGIRSFSGQTKLLLSEKPVYNCSFLQKNYIHYFHSHNNILTRQFRESGRRLYIVTSISRD